MIFTSKSRQRLLLFVFDSPFSLKSPNAMQKRDPLVADPALHYTTTCCDVLLQKKQFLHVVERSRSHTIVVNTACKIAGVPCNLVGACRL